ncbi:MAG: hypothetical protein DRJ10_01150 [Bacteroidetes bacterium]|nr:MAG: hypothetical protein DRJ10_01150 [Bacteroidota bacterium]
MTKKGSGSKGKAGKGKLSFSEKVSKALKKEDYSVGKTLCEIECKAFGTSKFNTMKRCKKCPVVVKEFCQEMLEGVYQEEETDKKDTDKPVKSEEVVKAVRNDQPYITVLKELIKGTKNKDIAVVIAGEVPTPGSFIGKVSCIYGVITGKSKSRGVIYAGVKELKAGKKITKTGSSGYVSKVWDAYQELKPAASKVKSGTGKNVPNKEKSAGASKGKSGKGKSKDKK